MSKTEAVNETKKSTKKAGQKAKEAVDKTVAIEIEAKKTSRAAGRKAKEKAEEVNAKIAEKASDKKAAVEIEAKKTAGKVKRAAKENTEKAKAVVDEAKKPARKLKAAKLDLVFESSMGGQITPEEIAAKVPAGANAAYIKLEENKIYWVKGEETGAVDIW